MTSTLPPRRAGFDDVGARRLRHLGLCGRGGLLGLDLRRRLVFAQPFEGGLTNEAIGRPAGELDLGHQLRLEPDDAGLLLRRADPGEGRLRRLDRLQLRQQVLDLGGAVARSDAADIDEVVAAIDADQKRPEFAVGRGIGADDHLMPGAALGFRPGLRAAGDVGRVGALRDDAFERQPAGRAQDRLAAGLEMLDEAEAGILAGVGEKLLQSRLALAQRQGAQILAAFEQQIEGEIDELVGLAFGKGRLKGGEIRGAVLVQRADLAIDDCVRQLAGGSAMAGYLAVQSRPLRVFKVASPSSTRIWMR